MNTLKKYWWLIVLFFLVYVNRSKITFLKKPTLKMGDNSDDVLKLQKWINTNYSGFNLAEDSKYGILTGSAIGWIISEDVDKRDEGRGKGFQDVVTNKDYWVDWLDLNWFSTNYGYK